jgi:hypothetical protein
MVVMVSFFAAAMTIVTGVVMFPASSPTDDANYSAAALGTRDDLPDKEEGRPDFS